MNNIFKSIGAIVAGFVVVVVLSIATDAVLESTGVLPPPDKGLYDTGLLLLALAYRTVYTVTGCYVAARLAPDRPMRHALILGVIGFAVGTFAAIATANMNLGPSWYAWAVAVEALPCAWLGGRLAEALSARRTA